MNKNRKINAIEADLNYEGLENEITGYLKNNNLYSCCILSIEQDKAIRVISVTENAANKNEFRFAEFFDYQNHQNNAIFQMIQEGHTIISTEEDDVENYFQHCSCEWYIPVKYLDNIFGCIYINTVEKDIVIDDLDEIVNIIYKHQLYISKIKQKKILNKIIIENIILINKVYDEKTLFLTRHSFNVALWAVEIAKELNYDNEKINDIYLAALIHDIGKIYIDSIIINKQGSYTCDEYDELKKHVEYGYNISKDILVAYSSEIPKWILQHHEKWDGTGYPNQLKGKQIIKEARILKIADSLDAMMSLRSYKSQLDVAKSIQELKKCSGSDFDPDVVKGAINVLSKHLNLKHKIISEMVVSANLLIKTNKKVINLKGYVSKLDTEYLFITKENIPKIEYSDVRSFDLAIERFNVIEQYGVIAKQIDSNKFLIEKVVPQEEEESFSLLWVLNGYIIDMDSKELTQITITKISAQGITFNFQENEQVLDNQFYALAIPFDDGIKVSMIGKIIGTFNINNNNHYEVVFTDIKEETKAQIYREIFRKQIEIRKELR